MTSLNSRELPQCFLPWSSSGKTGYFQRSPDIQNYVVCYLHIFKISSLMCGNWATCTTLLSYRNITSVTTNPLSGIPLYFSYAYHTQIQGLFSTGASIARTRGCLSYQTISITLAPVVEPRSPPIASRISGRVSWKRIRHHESSLGTNPASGITALYSRFYYAIYNGYIMIGPCSM